LAATAAVVGAMVSLNQLKPGSPQYGVPPDQVKQNNNSPPKPLSNKPSWNDFMHPDRWIKQLGNKPRPSEFSTDNNTTTKKGKKG
jgi:hypothetical protein